MNNLFLPKIYDGVQSANQISIELKQTLLFMVTSILHSKEISTLESLLFYLLHLINFIQF